MLLYLLTILFILIIYVIYHIKRKHNYWKVRSVKYDSPTFFFGSSFKASISAESISTMLNKIYDKFPNERYVGFYKALEPILLIKDIELIKQVMIKNFSYFPDHGFKIDEQIDPLEEHLFNLQGKKWKTLRVKLSPAFTSGKLKWMYDQMVICGDLLVDHLKSVEGTEIEIGDTLARFTTDVIGSCGFGIEPESIKDPNSKFRQMGKRIFTQEGFTLFKLFLRNIFPEFFVKLKLIPKDLDDFFYSLTKQTFEHRLQTGTNRNDFMQLLLQLKEKGNVDYDPVEIHEAVEELVDTDSLEDNGKLELTDGLLAAQSFVFFAAGFESSAAALSLICHSLAKYPVIQEIARKEVKEMKKKFNGISYDALKSMIYVEACVKEGTRMYPPFPVLTRICRKPIEFDDGTKIEPGITVMIPMEAIQNDPQIFPEPNVFKPERFLNNSTAPGTYLTFGDGPRICIARRFALLEMQLAIALILDNFKLTIGVNQDKSLKMDPRSIVLKPKNGIWLKIEKLEEIN